MRNPYDTRFLKTQQLMKSGMMVGKDRPVGRVTWSKGRLHATTSTKAGIGTVRYLDKSVAEHEMLMVRTIDITRSIGQDAATCTITLWNTRTDTARPEGIDTEGGVGWLTPGRGHVAPDVTTSIYDDIQDFYGTGRGYPTSWGYPVNSWRDALVPNSIIRTYQGYGSDNLDEFGNARVPGDPDYVAPSDDAQLYDTGVWLIDQVTFGADGTISVECRDVAKLLIEQYIYPPMIPTGRFPLIYMPAHQATGHKESIGKNVAKFHSSSVDKKYGTNHAIMGHRGTHAFDAKTGTFWLSGANASTGGVEWLQASVHGSVNEVVLNTYGGNYSVYIAVHENGKWQGTAQLTGHTENYENLSSSEGNGSGGFFYVITKGDTLWDLAGQYYGDNLKWPIIARANNNIIKDPHWIYPGQRIKIPYVAGTKSPPPANTGGQTGGTTVQIPYVTHATVPGSGKVTIKLPRTYKADYVRVLFTNLHHLVGDSDGFRAGVREMVVRNHISNTFKPSTIDKAGFIQDWSEPIKEMCAWAGLTWVNVPAPNAFDEVTGRSVVKTAYGASTMADPSQGITAPAVGSTVNLRVWGDFEDLGAGPVVATPGDYFLSKSFMDGIRQIVDFIGGVFYIDESGGAQFRLPNIWSSGQFLDDTSAASSLGARFSEHPIEFHEDANLVEYSMVISDESLRSEVLVIGGYPSVHAQGPIAGGYVLGYNSATGETSAIDFSNILAGQYRLMILPGDSTKLFYTEIECQRMAELTALFILFTYRQGSLKAPCHPGLQLDDQVRIYERITNESYIHYVSSINTHMDLESGEYTMQCTTHWLGGDPNTNWFINKAQLTPAVKNLPAIVKRVGREAGGDTFEQPPFGV